MSDTPVEDFEARCVIELGEDEIRDIIREEIERARREDERAIEHSRNSFEIDTTSGGLE